MNFTLTNKSNLNIYLRVFQRKKIITRHCYEMKRQRFYIFYSENEENAIEYRLLKAYVNRFCIDEEYQSEVSGFYQLNELSETSIACVLTEYANLVIFNRTRRLEWVYSIFHEAKLSLFTARNKNDIFEIHFMFGFPMNVFTENYILYISEGLTQSSDISFTILEGRSKQFRLPLRIENKPTIGDDMDLLNDQFQSLNSNIYYKSKSSSVFQKPDESLVQIECKRKSFKSIAKTRAYFRKWSNYIAWFLFVSVLFWVIFVFLKFYFWDNRVVRFLLVVLGITTFGVLLGVALNCCLKDCICLVPYKYIQQNFKRPIDKTVLIILIPVILYFVRAWIKFLCAIEISFGTN